MVGAKANRKSASAEALLPQRLSRRWKAKPMIRRQQRNMRNRIGANYAPSHVKLEWI